LGCIHIQNVERTAMSPPEANRDTGLRRISRTTRWLAGGAVALMGVVSAVAAYAAPGRSSGAPTAPPTSNATTPSNHLTPAHAAPGHGLWRGWIAAAGATAGSYASQPVCSIRRNMTNVKVGSKTASATFPALGTTATVLVTRGSRLAVARQVLQQQLEEID